MNYFNPYPGFGYSPPGNSAPVLYNRESLQQPYALNQNSAGNGVIWVQGEAGAKAYLIVPGSTVMLMDSEAMRFYLKSADASGVPSLRIFEYNEITNGSPPVPQPSNTEQYVTRTEYDKLLSRCDELAERIERMTIPESTKRAAKKQSGGAEDE